MINAQPWRTIVNANPLSGPVQKKSTLTVVTQAGAVKASYLHAVVDQTKRYSFDDNGGGYRGL